MAQWMNLHWNNSFENQAQLPLLCEKSGAILLWSYGRPAVRQNTGRLQIFKNSLQIASLEFSWCLTKVQCYYSVTNTF